MCDSRPEPEAIPARTEHRSSPKVRWWGVTVPTTGEYLVRNGKVMPVLESEFMDYVEGDVSYLVWVKKEET